jgi:hypothetical protein
MKILVKIHVFLYKPTITMDLEGFRYQIASVHDTRHRAELLFWNATELKEGDELVLKSGSCVWNGNLSY